MQKFCPLQIDLSPASTLFLCHSVTFSTPAWAVLPGALQDPPDLVV